MDSLAALERFLSGVLVQKKERYLGFISKPKNRVKFLNSIYHDLKSEFDKNKKIDRLPDSGDSIPGYRFSPPGDFGAPVRDIRSVLESNEDSFLVIAENGEIGILSPETFIDSRAIYDIT